MSRGSWGALLLLLGGSLALAPAGVAAPSGCGLVVPQDDARSQRDAGASPADAVELAYEDEYPASISYPQGSVVDAEDWFHASWSSDDEHRVMVNVSTRAAGLSYVLGERLPAPHLALEAYAPGEDEPRETGEVGPDGVVRLNFTTDRTDWHFRVFLPDEVALDTCPVAEDQSTSTDVQSYNMYWGCDPHCVTFNV